MTQTQTDFDGDASTDGSDGGEPETYHTAGANIGQSRLSRRGFMRAATAGGTAAAVAGGSLSTDQLGTTRASASMGAAYQASRVGAWLGDRIANVFGSDKDYSNYTGSLALWQDIEDDAVRMASRIEQTVSSLENTVEFSERVAIAEGSQAAMEGFEQEKSQEEVANDRKEAIDNYYSDIQKDIIDAHNSILAEIEHWSQSVIDFDPVDGDVDISPEDIMGTSSHNDGGTPTPLIGDNSHNFYFQTIEEEVINGDTVELYVESTDDRKHNILTGLSGGLEDKTVYAAAIYPSDWHKNNVDEDDHLDILYGGWPYDDDEIPFGRLKIEGLDESDIDNYDLNTAPVLAYSGRLFADLMLELQEAYTNVMNDMAGFESEIYDQLNPEDVDTSEMMTPTDTYESATEDTEHAWRDAALRSLGLDETPDDMEIELHDRGDDGVVVEGSIYALNADLSLETGERYDPEDFEETSLYISYWDDDGNAVEEELDEPFTVLSATDEDGDELDQVEFDEGPTYDPADVEQIEEELQKQREITEEMLAEQGGGGGIDLGGLGGWFSGVGQRAAAAGAGILALVFGAIALGGE